MKNEITIDAKALGLEESKAEQIKNQFSPATIEQDALIIVYEGLLKREINTELVKDADNLRKKLKGVRTHVERIRKAEKNFYLAGGKFVDAWSKKSVEPILIMEEKMIEISDYYKNQEKERIEKLQSERSGKLLSFEVEVIPQNLGEMEDSMWSAYIVGIETNFNARKEAEKKAEKERLEVERKAKEDAKKETERIEAQRLENERLKKEAEEKEAARLKAESEQKSKEERLLKEQAEKEAKIKTVADAKLKVERDAKEKEITDLKAKQEAKEKSERKEREELAKKEAEELANTQKKINERNGKRNKELKPFIVFIRDYSALLNSNEDSYQSQFSDIKKGAEMHWDHERKKMQKEAKIQADKDVEIEIERKAKNKLEAELKAKQESEAKAKVNQEAKEKAAKMAPEKIKLETFASMILGIELPDVKTDEAKEIVSNVEGLLKKVNNYILENVDKL